MHAFGATLPPRGGEAEYSSADLRGNAMTLCPVALAVGCRKCPVFNVCPAKGIIGDYKPGDDKPEPAQPKKTAGKKKS